MRRLRLGRRVVRPGLRGARALALRRAEVVHGRRAARRDLDRRAARARRVAAGPSGRRRRAVPALAGGERPAATRVRPRGGSLLRHRIACRARTPARTFRTRPRRSPTPSRRSASRPPRPSPRDRCSSRRSTAGRTESARCSRSPRRSRRARRPGSTSSARRSPPSCSSGSALADADTNLAEALDRWELSLFQHEPFRSEQLRAALDALLGTTWPLRASVLLEERRRGPRGAAPRSRGARRRRGGDRPRRRRPSGVRSSRCCATEIGRRSLHGSTACCSGLATPGRLRAAS